MGAGPALGGKAGEASSSDEMALGHKQGGLDLWVSAKASDVPPSTDHAVVRQARLIRSPQDLPHGPCGTWSSGHQRDVAVGSH